ncbi:hypothetical protein ACQ859_16025 [Roseateles chitinivorans]
MGARYNMEVPDVLNNKITAAAAEDEVSKAEIIPRSSGNARVSPMIGRSV